MAPFPTQSSLELRTVAQEESKRSQTKTNKTMNAQDPRFTLMVIGQLLRALLASTAQHDANSYMPVTADNVTVAGLTSDVQLIASPFDPNYIKPMDPRGFIVPTSSVAVSVTPDFDQPKAMYDVWSQSKF
jgi:hypothetical protein